MSTDIKSVVCFSVILFTVFFSACVDSDVDDYEHIVGTWQWYESSGGFAGVIETPEATGETRKVVFEEDGTVSFYKNGTVTLTSTYALGKEKTIFSEEPLPVLIVDSASFLYAYSFPVEDELELLENVYDGFAHNYRKE